MEVLGFEVVSDFGANITLSGNVALQTIETHGTFIGGRDVAFQSNAFELYF